MRHVIKQAWAAAALSLCVSGTALADEHQGFRNCRSWLSGLYAFSATGFTFPNGVAQPKAIVELLRFNGDGTITVQGATISFNGVITQVPPGGSGVYTLNADCRGTVVFNDNRGTTYDIYVAPSGDDLWMIQTAGTPANNAFQGNATKVAP
jgi:hypothetical protein